MEKEWCWHKKCVKRFFQTDELPILDITKEQLEILANEIVNEGLTVPGVQKKLSLHLSTDLNARLTIVDYPTGYILKPQTEEFDNMPEFEDLAMRLAEIMGIQTVPHALIKMNDEYAYITKRIDREISEKETKLYAMEDFCQLSYRLTPVSYTHLVIFDGQTPMLFVPPCKHGTVCGKTIIMLADFVQVCQLFTILIIVFFSTVGFPPGESTTDGCCLDICKIYRR